MIHFGRTSQTLFLSCLLILVLGFFRYDYNSVQFENHFDDEIPDKFWRDRMIAEPVFDAVVLGNSRVYRGVVPLTMSSILKDWNIINLGFSSGGLNSTIYAFGESKLSPNSNYPTIILGVSPTALMPESKKNDHYYSILNKMQKDLWISGWLHSVGIDVSFEAISLETIFNMATLDNQSNFNSESYVYAEPKSGGWIASDEFPRDHSILMESYSVSLSNADVSTDLIDEMLSQIKDWTERGIHVYAFRPPASPELTALEDELSSFDESFVKSQIEQAGGVWIDVNPVDFESYDASHLVYTSAHDLSLYLAEAIQRNLYHSNS